MDENKISKLKEMLKMVNDGLTKEDFTNAFKEVISLVQKIESDLIKKINTKLSDKVESIDSEISSAKSEIESEIFSAKREIMSAQQAVRDARTELQQIVQETRDANTTTLSQLRTRALESIDSLFTKMRLNDRFNTLLGDYTSKVEELNTRIGEVPTTEQILALIPPQKEETAEETRDKLETLKENERLDVSAIKGLEDEIKNLRKEIATKSSGGVRRVFQPYVDDFSALTNGSTKIFYLSREPLKANTVLVWGTDFPVLLRPNTDFTVAGKVLTLTSAVSAPSVGATLIVRYDS